MALRVVLYAEGAGETQGEMTFPAAPGSPLSDDRLGAGHILVRRAIARESSYPEPAVQFESPLLTIGRTARGSDFLVRRRLRQLLTWPTAHQRPDLVVVLVDADGHTGRKKVLAGYVKGLLANRVIAVPVQEFEAWLVADHATVSGLLPQPVAAPSAPESLQPGEAKKLFASWGGERRDIARSCDLERVRSRCRAFRAFLKDLRACLAQSAR